MGDSSGYGVAHRSIGPPSLFKIALMLVCLTHVAPFIKPRAAPWSSIDEDVAGIELHRLFSRVSAR